MKQLFGFILMIPLSLSFIQFCICIDLRSGCFSFRCLPKGCFTDFFSYTYITFYSNYQNLKHNISLKNVTTQIKKTSDSLSETIQSTVHVFYILYKLFTYTLLGNHKNGESQSVFIK